MEYKSLNGIRAIAALLVVFAHFSGDIKMFDKTSIVQPHLAIGAVGVMTFFILSGFLMMHVTSKKVPTKRNIYNFYVSRLARVWPLFFSAIVFTFIYQLIFGGWLEIGRQNLAFNTFRSPLNALANLLLIQGNSIYWTIGVEILFYLIFPFFWYFGRRFNTLAFFALLLILYIVSWETNFFFTRSFIMTRLNTCLQYFLLGCLIYKTLKHPFNSSIFCSTYFNVSSTVFSIVCIVFLCPQVAYYIFPDIANDWGYKAFWTKHWHLLILFAVIFISIIKFEAFSTFLQHKVLQFLGSISYSIYLTHRFIVKLAVPLGLEGAHIGTQLAVFLGIILPLIIGVSYMTWLYIEKPAQIILREKFIIT